MKKVSLMLLTYNRKKVTERSIRNNIKNAGYPIHEIIWVDNNSTDGIREIILQKIQPDVSILHKDNLGVAKGYNAGYKLCRGDLIARPGTDMMMPKDWLKTMVKYHDTIPNTGICSVTSVPIDRVSAHKNRKEFNGLFIYPEVVIGSILFDRRLFDKIGYLPECFGKYGWDDVLWAKKAMGTKYINYYIDEITSVHMGSEDHIEYQKQKIREVKKYEDEFVKKMEEEHARQISRKVSRAPESENQNDGKV